MTNDRTFVINGFKRTRYEIHSDGTVVSLGRVGQRGYVVKDRKLVPHRNSSGYLRVSMNLTGKNREYFIHRLVAQCFVDNPENKPVVNHKDGDKSNNHFSNLEWVTSSENSKHAFRSGLSKAPALRGEKHSMHKLSQADVDYIRAVHTPWDSDCGSKALAERFGVRPQTITEIVHGRSWLPASGLIIGGSDNGN